MKISGWFGGRARVLAAAIALGAVGAASGIVVSIAHDDSSSVASTAQAAARSAVARASTDQQAVLADGVVSDAEYDHAVAQVGACLEQTGVKVELQPRVGKRPPSVGFATANLADGKQAEEALAGCDSKYLREIRTVYLAQFVTDESAPAQARQYIGDCLARAGFEVPPGPVADEQIVAWRADPATVEDVVRCSLERRESLGF